MMSHLRLRYRIEERLDIMILETLLWRRISTSPSGEGDRKIAISKCDLDVKT